MTLLISTSIDYNFIFIDYLLFTGIDYLNVPLSNICSLLVPITLSLVVSTTCSVPISIICSLPISTVCSLPHFPQAEPSNRPRRQDRSYFKRHTKHNFISSCGLHSYTALSHTHIYKSFMFNLKMASKSRNMSL